MAYKIVIRHILDEEGMKHDENCEDIVYMIDTGYGKYPVAFKTREEAEEKIKELENTRN